MPESLVRRADENLYAAKKAGRNQIMSGEAEPAKAAPAPAPEPTKAGVPVKNGFDGMPAPGTDAFCPVMKHEFKVAANSPFSVHEGKTYVFCCPSCKEPFENDPKKYLSN